MVAEVAGPFGEIESTQSGQVGGLKIGDGERPGPALSGSHKTVAIASLPTGSARHIFRERRRALVALHPKVPPFFSHTRLSHDVWQIQKCSRSLTLGKQQRL